jgi:hypothetical protein
MCASTTDDGPVDSALRCFYKEHITEVEWRTVDAELVSPVEWITSGSHQLTPASLALFVHDVHAIFVHSANSGYGETYLRLARNPSGPIFRAEVGETGDILRLNTPVDGRRPYLAISVSGEMDQALWKAIRESSARVVCVGIYDELDIEEYRHVLWELTRMVREASSLDTLHVNIEPHRRQRIPPADFPPQPMRRFLLAVAASRTLREVFMQPRGMWTVDATHLACASGATCNVYAFAEPDRRHVKWSETTRHSDGSRSRTFRRIVESGNISKRVTHWPDANDAAHMREWGISQVDWRAVASIVVRGRISDGPWPAKMSEATEVIVSCQNPLDGTETTPVFSEENMRRLVAMAPVASAWTFIGEMLDVPTVTTGSIPQKQPQSVE